MFNSTVRHLRAAAQIGFVLHNRSPLGAARPRLPAPIPGRAVQIGFVLHNRLRRGPEVGGSRGEAEAPGPAGQIGFVLRICPASPAPLAPPHAASPGKLGSFCTFRSPAEPRPHTATVFAYISQSTQVWLRFAQFPPPSVCIGTKLGSFCTFHSPAEPRPRRRPLPTCLSPPKFWFVLHDSALRRSGVPAGHLSIRNPQSCHPGPRPGTPIRNMSLRGATRRGNLGPPASLASHLTLQT
jgi:hypothetical protein